MTDTTDLNDIKKWMISLSTDDSLFNFDTEQYAGERLVTVYEDADRQSIPNWKKHEEQFDGLLIFKIKPHTDKIDVLVITSLNEKDVALKGVVVYATWQLNHK